MACYGRERSIPTNEHATKNLRESLKGSSRAVASWPQVDDPDRRMASRPLVRASWSRRSRLPLDASQQPPGSPADPLIEKRDSE